MARSIRGIGETFRQTAIAGATELAALFMLKLRRLSVRGIVTLVVFLASYAAKSISGQVLPVDNDRQRA
ncbi:MAG: hypothetical protein ACREQD_17380 [Candidatus Binataceae bacterium]